MREMTPDELVAKFEEAHPHGTALFMYPRLILERERAAAARAARDVAGREGEVDISDWLAVHKLHDPADEALHRRVCLGQPVSPPPDALREALEALRAWEGESIPMSLALLILNLEKAVDAAILRAQGVVQSPDE
jgi:hypothetical protein